MTETLMEEEFSGHLNLQLWRRLLRYGLAHKRLLIPLVFISGATAGCDAAMNLIVKGIIDSAVRQNSAGVLGYSLAMAGLIAVLCTCVFSFIVVAGKASAGIGHDIRRDVFGKLQELEFAYYDRRPVGWLMARATGDCGRLGSLLAWGTMDFTWGIFMMIALAVIMLVLQWKLALIVFAVVPPLAIISIYFQRLMLGSSRAMRKTNSLMTASFNEGIMAVRTTKTLVRERQNLQEFQKLSGEMYVHSLRNAMQSALYLPFVLTIGACGIGLALWFGGLSAMQSVFSLGTMIVFINCAGQFFNPVHELARVMTNVYASQASLERVLGLLDTQPQIADSPRVVEAMAVHTGRPLAGGLACDGLDGRIRQIEFRNVGFAYKQGKAVLEDFNLTVQAGQTIALAGPTGGGKSTIVALLCRFYEPTSGQILLNGQDYRERSLNWLQSNLGIVLQTPHLFSGTVRENIRYGRLAASDKDVEQAARVVSAEEFILAMDKGYDSEVGQGGNRLSLGQKQLISLARAVLADPQIFIMDEATSSVDTHTEALIQRGVESLLQKRTSFVIAHRLSTIRSADRILVIAKGKIVEQGSHHDLIRLRGRYYELYTNQFTQEKEDRLLHVDGNGAVCLPNAP